MIVTTAGPSFHENRTILVAIVLLSVSVPRCAAADEKASCATCHAAQSAELGASVHAALSCQECHGGDASYSLLEDKLKKYKERSATSVIVFEHGDAFHGKPARLDIPDKCGGCHADVTRMNPFGLPTDQLARYWTSHHGKAIKENGDERVAVCVDCHGSHGVLSGTNPESKTYPLNVPDTCGRCHADEARMAPYELPTQVVSEYHQSVHGLLLQQGDTGAPTCATCHGNHAAVPPGFATVGTVCGQCHDHVAKQFAKSTHAEQEEHRGCVQCHGGGEGRHFHMISRITKPPGVLIQRYAHLLSSHPAPTAAQVSEAIHPGPKQIITQALSTCTDCHDDIDEDESLPKLFALLDDIAVAERRYVETANRLDRVATGVLLVDNQRFKFEDAKTHLIALAPLQHTLDNAVVAEEVAKLTKVCDEVDAELDELEAGLAARHMALIPIWIVAVLFAGLLYVKFKQLKRQYVEPLPKDPGRS